MNYKVIDMKQYKRREHFSYFSDMAYPYVGITVNVDITEWLAIVKEKNLPFFLSFLYAVTNAANSVKEFRQRISADGQIIEFEKCLSSYTVALPDETYCYCQVDADMSYLEFLACAQAEQKKVLEEGSIDDGEQILQLFFVSSIPWLSYTSLVQPVPAPADSNPRITWGKYFRQNQRMFVPLTLLCHHALVDGLHFAQFFDSLDNLLAEFTASFTKL
ncbi:MAG: chloramphenicol acetyltransferase [Lachnospiraceae bacterium]|nr:chloramphenicol acetyltransferase [Lachnospiraceae bacterium]